MEPLGSVEHTLRIADLDSGSCSLTMALIGDPINIIACRYYFRVNRFNFDLFGFAPLSISILTQGRCPGFETIKSPVSSLSIL